MSQFIVRNDLAFAFSWRVSNILKTPAFMESINKIHLKLQNLNCGVVAPCYGVDNKMLQLQALQSEPFN